MEIANLTNNTNKVVEDFYAALAAKNLDKIVNQFSDDVDWFIAGEETLAPWLGQRNNRQEVKEFGSCVVS
nr:nuclear transport factor 2 family protein [Acidobacteriota bacterium]